MYEQELCAAVFADRDAKAASPAYAILAEFRMFTEAPENILQFLDSRGSLLQQSSAEFLEFVRSELQDKEELRAVEN